MADRAYSDEELDAAVASIADPARLRDAQDLVMRTAPGLQRLLATALDEGGWFDTGHAQAMSEAATREDLDQRLLELRTLMAEETRLGMLVGVAVGYELALELERPGRAGRQDENPNIPTQED